jgi:hypothetical protein
LLQALAWAVNVDDIARAKVKSNREMRNFMVPPDFSWKARWPHPSFERYLAARRRRTQWRAPVDCL